MVLPQLIAARRFFSFRQPFDLLVSFASRVELDSVRVV